ncbi:MAG: 3-keto-5-aminohexanoate cleavage protein [bacterium]
MKKLIINLAPTGMIPTKELTPHVPVTPGEIIEDALRCAALGASMIHIHARDQEGVPSFRKEIFQEIICGIRQKAPELILVVTTSGRTYSEFAQRAEALDLTGDAKPDMASLTLSSLNFNRIASVNSPDMILRLAGKMREQGIKPELEIFDLGMVNVAHYLINKSLLTPPYYFNILLGNIAAAQARLIHLGLIVSELPAESVWSVAGIGDFQKPMNALGVIAGDGVRVGLEDNIWMDESRTCLASNADLTGRVAQLARVYGRDLSTPAETRARLGL